MFLLNYSISEVTGRFDIMTEVYGLDLEDLHTIVIEKIGKIEGIQNTETFVELQKTCIFVFYIYFAA